jgi:DNA invertase Pin-like site-specific DNA recombinase
VDAKAQFRSLAEPWADTGTSTSRLVIAALGGLADVERDLIRTRTAEGRNACRTRAQLPRGKEYDFPAYAMNGTDESTTKAETTPAMVENARKNYLPI